MLKQKIPFMNLRKMNYIAYTPKTLIEIIGKENIKCQ